MYFLSIESSTQNFAIALNLDGKVLRHKTVKHAKLLEDVILKNIDALLSQAKVPFSKIDAFVVGLGPGSFTSLRVGLSTVKAFCLATQKPLVGICSLDIIAYAACDASSDDICVIVDARRNLVYSAIYQKTATGLKLRKGYTLSSFVDVAAMVKPKTLFVGDAVGIYAKDIQKIKGICAPEKMWLPTAKVLAMLGQKRIEEKAFDDAATVVPIYLYEDDCQVSPSKKV